MLWHRACCLARHASKAGAESDGRTGLLLLLRPSCVAVVLVLPADSPPQWMARTQP